MQATRRRELLDMREAAQRIFGHDDPAGRKWLYKHRKHLPSELFVQVGGRLLMRARRLDQWLAGDGGGTGE